ncbi:SDR family NAD(P)-dependent oxidoreductase [Tropicimonas sp. IMCC34043]|uniref:SDR family NAD(P)-dependent oxidoreductase n=1 Tax=Tropicimonas sp. IMCC34043 TaxID=2248760 RepID=UPI000E276B79|nr:SDR family NAD(P)-dependent oxidoreductase [Tropicimonas sp. IMCC34043]
MNKMDIAGHVAVITGGSGDVGRAVAARMLADGATVYAFDLNAAALAAAAADLPGLRPITVDLLDEARTRAAFATVQQDAGRLDILANCVGIEGLRTSTEEQDIAAWRRVMEINVTAPLIAAKYAIPVMRLNGYGKIVFLGSTAGKDGNAFGAAYSASKSAIMTAAKSIGKELAQTGILVNCVTPAALDSALFDRSAGPAGRQNAPTRIPMGRLGMVDEVAAMVCWLCSPDCSFSTGGVFDVSGGRSTY